LKVLSLTDNAGWLMAVGNDLDYDQIFVQQLMNYGSEGDVVIAISGSGNSPNVLNAVEWANRHKLVTFGLTGYSGGKLKDMQQDGLHVPLDDGYDRGCWRRGVFSPLASRWAVAGPTMNLAGADGGFGIRSRTPR